MPISQELTTVMRITPYRGYCIDYKGNIDILEDGSNVQYTIFRMYLAGTFDTLALNWTQMQFYAIKGSKEKRNRNYKYLLDW